MRHAALLSLLASLHLGACGTSETGTGTGDGTDDWGDGLGTPENPVPAKSGPYAMVNKVDFTVEQIVPAQVALVVATLRDFSTNPAHALISIADRAGVPAASTIYSLVPGPIKSRFEGWINGEVAKAKVNGKPITEYAGDVAKLFEYALTDFAVDSELTIDSAESVTHRLTALDLRPTGIDFVLPIGGLAGDVLTQSPTISIAEGGSIVFGEQHFGLNYGEYAWQAIEGVTMAAFGTTIKGTFLKAMNCPALAQAVADKCVLGVCVGHETEIRSVCVGGISAIVDFVHDQVAAHRIEALHFASGGARLVDDDADGVGDRIVDGDWDAEMNFGLGLRHTNATFSGAR